MVVDEQHRFGVEQRDVLRDKAGQGRPHVLVMTATPIPRTVAMTVFGDLEVSTLTELPAGRSPISTHVVPAAEKPRLLERAWQRVREEVGPGPPGLRGLPADRRRARRSRRTTPADEPDSDGGAERRPPIAVTELAAQLAAGPLAGLRLGVLHGRLPPDEKDRVMLRVRGRARSTCWSPPRSSRSASTCRTPPPW